MTMPDSSTPTELLLFMQSDQEEYAKPPPSALSTPVANILVGPHSLGTYEGPLTLTEVLSIQHIRSTSWPGIRGGQSQSGT